ncbi:MAG: phosphate ABC transporter ATP-binding protein [Rhodospirillales bacterium 70-18]|nr:amino acid ABC transporter ATP-binding protein [Rhodospirillales bacterium]OJY70410.1 MAG: phosphate ABC transporter ATP-binding protein [Rhodospirillales bacterium 70-18]
MSAAQVAIRARGVGKRFGANQVLADIALEAREGEVTCLIGPSGSGKSTLLRCMAFLERHDEGTIEVFGRPMGFGADAARRPLPEADVAAVRRDLGMVFQQFNLWPHMTALGNVSEALKRVRRLPRREAEGRAMAMLEKVGLGERAAHYPSELSGGQQQRVAIARALAMEPRMVLFDEPTSSLDPELTGEVLTVMRQLAQDGMTMVVVTHEIGFAAQVAQHVVFLDGGRVLLDGRAGEVFRQPWHPRLGQFLQTYLDLGASVLFQG